MAQKPLSHQKQTRIKQLAAQGHSHRTIAKLTGVHPSSVDTYVNLDQARQIPIQAFRTHTGDLLAENYMVGSQKLHNLLTGIKVEDILALPPDKQIRSAKDLGVLVAVLSDKLRLHEGKSTANLAHQLQVERVHKSLVWDATGGVSMSSTPVDIISQTENSKDINAS